MREDYGSDRLDVAHAIRFTINSHKYSINTQLCYLHGSLTLSNILVLRSHILDDKTEFAPFLLTTLASTLCTPLCHRRSNTYRLPQLLNNRKARNIGERSVSLR